MFSRMSILLATFTFSMVAQATLIDFTDQSWKDAIGSGQTSATVGNVTLTSTSGYLNFNGSSSERTGCQAGQPDNGLACLGDGIGISDDEITQRTSESITISFANSVNVDNIFLLDLFGTEGTGETAGMDQDRGPQARRPAAAVRRRHLAARHPRERPRLRRGQRHQLRRRLAHLERPRHDHRNMDAIGMSI